MRYILIPEKNIFSCAIDSKTPDNDISIEFLNLLALKKAEKGYAIATIPLSLVNEFNTSQFFKNAKTIDLISAFIHIDPSVFSSKLDEDYFEVGRVNADKQPLIVTNRTDLEGFRGIHTTPIVSIQDAVKLIRESDSRF